tara:strand:+ start:212 stop:370 length:159 start_codon:yes stop_codon:yes gene_type:complete
MLINAYQDDAEFVTWESEAIETGGRDTAKSEYKVLKSSCFNCHREYRANTRK